MSSGKVHHAKQTRLKTNTHLLKFLWKCMRAFKCSLRKWHIVCCCCSSMWLSLINLWLKVRKLLLLPGRLFLWLKHAAGPTLMGRAWLLPLDPTTVSGDNSTVVVSAATANLWISLNVIFLKVVWMGYHSNICNMLAYRSVGWTLAQCYLKKMIF